ncbi:unnamed protein product [Calicophoron daubneyi]|uniref:Uncharacterized protein n=1 Tax=Calicophoron daubneyi TaxID=300641 RepID=A0AAV2T4D6_CALDB
MKRIFVTYCPRRLKLTCSIIRSWKLDLVLKRWLRISKLAPPFYVVTGPVTPRLEFYTRLVYLNYRRCVHYCDMLYGGFSLKMLVGVGFISYFIVLLLSTLSTYAPITINLPDDESFISSPVNFSPRLSVKTISTNWIRKVFDHLTLDLQHPSGAPPS